MSGTEGRVGIQFVVNEDGSISGAEVFHKASSLLDAEALRVVKAMPKWKPGKQGCKAVKCYFTLPITFALF
jgi:TonB family protein